MATKKKAIGQGALLDQDSTQAGVAPSPTNEGLRGSHSPNESGHLHVARVVLRNFGGVGQEERALDFVPGANVVVGANASGKTSVLHAIRCALRISRSAASRNAHIGSEGRPEITLTLRRGDEGEIIVRCVGDESPTVREIVGEDVRDVPRAVEFLKGLVDVAGADPKAFEDATPDEQAEMLLEALDFPNYSRAAALEAAGLQGFRLPAIPDGLHALEDIEKIAAAVEEARRATGSERDMERATAAKLLKDLPAQAPTAPKDQAAAQAEADKLGQDLAAEEQRIKAEYERTVDVAKATAETEAGKIRSGFEADRAKLRADHEAEAARLRAACEKRVAELLAEVETKVDDLRTKGDARLAEIDKETEAAERAANKAAAVAIAALTPRHDDLQKRRAALLAGRQGAEAYAADTKVRTMAAEAKAKAETHERRWKELDESLRALRRHAAELAGAAPIKGLVVSFDEKGKRLVTLDSKPLDKLSASESSALAARVAALRSRSGGTERPLKLILLDEIGRTTLSRRRALLEELTAGGAQVIAALASEDAELGVRGPEAA